MRLARLSILGSLLAGCSSGGAGHPGTSSSGTPNPAPASTGAAVVGETSIGPIPLAPGQEVTVCTVSPLDNDDAMVVSSLDAELTPGSHHLIVSKADGEEENLTPTPCQTFSSVLSGRTKPLLIVNTPHGTLTFPAGVGLEVASHQMVRLEAHYLNDTSGSLQGSGTVKFNGLPVSKAGTYQAADTYIWGTARISIPAGSMFTTPLVFHAGAAGMNLFSVTTHEHRLGTEVKAWSNTAAGSPGTQIADDTNWSEPTWRTFDAPMPMNGTNGLSFQCTWNNTTADTVKFGESALQEMCFLIGFYYPSHGLDLCIDDYCLEHTADGGGVLAKSSGDAGAD